MTLPAPQTHESKGILCYTGPDEADYPGLAPYWALSDLAINQYDGYAEVSTTIDGEEWDLRLNYHKSGFAPRDDDPVDAPRLYEWDLTVDGRGERGGSYQISPRYPDLEHYESGETVSVPFDHLDADEGLSVQWNISNVGLDEVADLFPRFVSALFAEAGDALNDRYLQRPQAGWIQEVELYVRIERGLSEKITKKGGILDRLAMLLSDTRGVSGEYKFDNSEAKGYIHQFRTGRDGASEMIDHHSRGKQVKLYLPENPDAHSETDPLYHHKLGALFRKSLNGDQSVRWSDRADLVDELEETVFNILSWSDIPLESGGPPYVPDDHFDPTETLDTEPTLYDDPTPRLEADSEVLFLRTFRDITDSGLELVEAVATDGGKRVREFAEEAEYHVSTVYRALQELDEVLECENGRIEFVNERLAEEIHNIVASVEDRVESAADRAAHLIDYDVRDAGNSAFERWVAHYGADIETPSDTDDAPTVRIGTVLSEYKSSSAPLLDNVLEELLLALKSDGRDISRWSDAMIEVQLDSSGRVKTPLSTLR